MKRLVLVFFAIIVIVIALLEGRAPIHRSGYGVSPADLQACERTEIISWAKVYPPPGKYDQEEIANIYLPYAIASLNAYTYMDEKTGEHYEMDGEMSKFTLAVYSPNEWERKPRKPLPRGLALDYYFNKNKPGIFPILIAFRGTEFYSTWDWYSNLSWLTRLIP